MPNRDSFIGFGRLFYREAAADALRSIESFKVNVNMNMQKAKAMSSGGAMNYPRRIEPTVAEPAFRLTTSRYNDLLNKFIYQLDGATIAGKSIQGEACEIHLFDNADALTGAPSMKIQGIYGHFSVDSVDYGRDNFAEPEIVCELVAPMPTLVTTNLSDFAPTITNINPDTGSADDKVTITGTNFIDVAGVMIGDALLPMAFKVNSDTEIDAFIPAAAATGVIRVVTLHGAADSAEYTVV